MGDPFSLLSSLPLFFCVLNRETYRPTASSVICVLQLSVPLNISLNGKQTDKTQMAVWLFQLLPTTACSKRQGCIDGWTKIISFLLPFPPSFFHNRVLLLLSGSDWCKGELALTFLLVIRTEWQSLHHDTSRRQAKGRQTLCMCVSGMRTASRKSGWQL